MLSVLCGSISGIASGLAMYGGHLSVCNIIILLAFIIVLVYGCTKGYDQVKSTLTSIGFFILFSLIIQFM